MQKKTLTKSRPILQMQDDAISKSDQFNIVKKSTFQNYYSGRMKYKYDTN